MRPADKHQLIDPRFIDPMRFKEVYWPDVQFYDKQLDVIYSVCNNAETVVTAGNELGKDFVAGFICTYMFATRHPVRIVTTSVKDDHLRVLWGEIGNFIQNAAHPLDSKDGGPLICNFREIKKVFNGKIDPKSYLKGMVSERGEGLQGHHAAYTMFVGDECSGLDDIVYKMVTTWADKLLLFGNPWPCENFFKHAVKGRPGTTDTGGDVYNESGKFYFRKIIQIRAVDSPNVKLALLQEQRGETPTREVLIPGVKEYDNYLRDRMMRDLEWQTTALDAEFYEGASIKLFPAEWLEMAVERYKSGNLRTGPRSLGVDSAEGGDRTAFTISDPYKVIYQESALTPDTTAIVKRTIELMREFHVLPENVLFDRGGGGKQHVDRLRMMGYNVRSIGFGESATDIKKHDRGLKTKGHRVDADEIRQAYKNRRAEMFGLLSAALQPDAIMPLAIPPEILDKVWAYGRPTLRGQLLVFPKMYDEEGKLYLPSKTRKPDEDTKNSNKKTLVEMIGCSPDEADSLACSVFVHRRKAVPVYAGVA